MKKLEISEVLKDGFSIAFKNILSLIGAFLLWVITIWIPYLNVGTTIAILSIPLELSRGNVISPTFIFDSKYRKRMGEFFLLMAFMYSAMIVGMFFLFVPAIVISYAFSLAIYILIDKGVNPLQAIKLSNEYTYGNKWRMFFINLIAGVICGIALGIVSIFMNISIVVWFILYLAVMLIMFAWLVSINAVYYRELVGNSEEVQAAE